MSLAEIHFKFGITIGIVEATQRFLLFHFLDGSVSCWTHDTEFLWLSDSFGE